MTFVSIEGAKYFLRPTHLFKPYFLCYNGKNKAICSPRYLLCKEMNSMIYAYEEGNSLCVVDYTDDGAQNLFCDATGEHLFHFVDTDLSKFMELFLTYFDSRINRTTLECKETETDLMEQLYTTFTVLHPFFQSDEHTSSLPYMLANTLNQVVEKAELTKEHYMGLLSHLTGPALNSCCKRAGRLSPYYDSALFAQRFYEEYRQRDKASIHNKWRKDGIGGIVSLQKYIRSYLYWILDSTAARFDALTQEQRLRLFSSVFGSSNAWQPFAIRDVLCPGTPNSHAVADILRKGQSHILENLSDMDSVVDETQRMAAEEIERSQYAKVLEELVSDSELLSEDIADWLAAKVDNAIHDDTTSWFRAYEIASFSDYLLLQVSLLTEKKVIIKRCKNCGRYFIPEKISIDYCHRILPGETQSCYEIGPKRVFNKLLAADLPRNLYSKAYKKYQARLRRKVITEDEFNTWRENAKEYLENVQHGLISTEEYTEWMQK